MRAAVGVIAVCCVLGASAGQAAIGSRTVPLHGSLRATWKPTGCPPGTGAVTTGKPSCRLATARGSMLVLGKAADQRIVVVALTKTNCERVRFSFDLSFGSKGTIGGDAASSGCVDPRATRTVVSFTVTGGTGAFAKSGGNGTVTISNAHGHSETETWKGTVTRSG
jgi:hypothetical protein